MIKAKKSLPVYLQLADELRDKILNGDYEPNEMLPSETDMIKLKNVSRMTVRNAVSLLADEGLVRKVQGRGTFVVAPTVMENFLGFHNYAQNMRKRGMEPSFRILRHSVQEAPKTLCPVLELPADSEVHSVHRLKLGDGLPLMFERLFLPVDLFPTINEDDLRSKWLTELLPECFGLHLSRAHKVVQPIIIGGQEAAALEIPARSLGLLVDRVSWTREIEERPTLVTRSIVRGDIARFSVDLNSSDDGDY